jgi:hypothetical protein
MEAIERAYQLFCRRRFPLPSEKQVADLELRLGIVLPGDYREFLLRFNGGYFFEPRIVPPVEGCPSDCLDVLAGIGATDPSAELGSPDGFSPDIFDDNEPPQILPIGYTLMGSLIFLITHADDNGWVGLKKADSDDSFLIGKTIEEFFDRLRPRSVE